MCLPRALLALVDVTAPCSAVATLASFLLRLLAVGPVELDVDELEDTDVEEVARLSAFEAGSGADVCFTTVCGTTFARTGMDVSMPAAGLTTTGRGGGGVLSGSTLSSPS